MKDEVGVCLLSETGAGKASRNWEEFLVGRWGMGLGEAPSCGVYTPAFPVGCRPGARGEPNEPRDWILRFEQAWTHQSSTRYYWSALAIAVLLNPASLEGPACLIVNGGGTKGHGTFSSAPPVESERPIEIGAFGHSEQSAEPEAVDRLIGTGLTKSLRSPCRLRPHSQRLMTRDQGDTCWGSKPRTRFAH